VFLADARIAAVLGDGNQAIPEILTTSLPQACGDLRLSLEHYVAIVQGLPQDIGWAHTSEDVSAFRSPDVETLPAYQRAVLQRTRDYIATLSLADLDRQLDEPWFQPLPTVCVRLVSILSDDLQHAGQIAYVRGLLKGKGWLEASSSIG